MKYYHNDNLAEVAPAFHHYVKSLVPENMEHETQTTIDFFCQILAYCINPIKKRPHFFAMYGKQDTGKSFFPELLEHIIGEQFFVKRKMADMENRFAASDLWGSKIFVDDDVKANLKLPDDFIKFYSGEKSITIEKKNKDAIKGVKISVAMFFISNHSFSVSGGVVQTEKRDNNGQKKKDEKPDAIIPIPSSAAEALTQKVQSKFYIETWGKATEIYPYKNIDGETLFCTCRFEKDTGKSVLPFYFTASGWYNGRPKLKKFPLYHEQQLKENRLPVIIVEGERCANVKIDGYGLVS